ncbi:deoxyribose-phosphate aldolase/phospho-2-dehydro-3-deoxyheptonate aldolase [Methanofollis liminatans DSM 4140]|uniref:fructose-bisphosphate aldolase n=1 Tax=Methanofollis liminatans DSM 4140 TaxID=28892 RepID=J0RZ82_9EURY|nr:aldolase [Methanofollis liminatans]EJG06841.1 deoxyribose-phosphate aldolase/phospho-2-dehydro-3-deoxyheptonate aldolase [Methanofollis liminatans DSM 4140]
MSANVSVSVPADVPDEVRETYIDNFSTITKGTGRLMLFAGDQKIEHLNDDFYGDGIHQDDAEPEHLFRIASQGRIGVFATQIGLVARYGRDYPEVPYLVKLNSKTHLVKTAQKDPASPMITTVAQVVALRNQTGLKIAAVGYTIYLGSEFEAQMLAEAAQAVLEAHQHGLLTVLWIYPRGAAVKDEKDPHLIAGATGVAACLGSDFVKVNAPKKEGTASAVLLKEATLAAGRTKVVCAGGSSVDEAKFLKELYEQIHTGGCSGNATGRNIHQKSLEEAVRMCNAISAITIDGASLEDALALLKGN